MNRLERIVQIETRKSAPQYELRVRRHGATDTEYEIWQVPSTATPQVKDCRTGRGAAGAQLGVRRAPGAETAYAGRNPAEPRGR